jgi:hypothetical protein
MASKSAGVISLRPRATLTRSPLLFLEDFIGGNTLFCRVDIKEVQSLKHTFNIESTPTFKILIAEEQVI